MKDLFKGAKFGDRFKTERGKLCIYVKDGEDGHLIMFASMVMGKYNDDGTPLLGDIFPKIIGRYTRGTSRVVSDVVKARMIVDDYLAMIGVDDPVSFFKSRTVEDVNRRHILIKILREKTCATLESIGRICLLNHSTILLALERFEDRRKYVKGFDKQYKEIYTQFNRLYNYES